MNRTYKIHTRLGRLESPHLRVSESKNRCNFLPNWPVSECHVYLSKFGVRGVMGQPPAAKAQLPTIPAYTDWK